MERKGFALTSILAIAALGVIAIGSIAYFQLRPKPAPQLQKNQAITQQKLSPDQVLFEKIEGWGPCTPDKICRQSTKLFYSGKLKLEGEKNIETQIDETNLENIIKKMRFTGIMNRDCSLSPVPDYSATYTLIVDDQRKIIRFPSCQEELREIEKLIPNT